MAEFTGDWSDVAPGWDQHRAGIEETNRVLTDALLDALALAAGQRVLELGGGNGELAARLAGLVGPGGSVLTSDVADGMVALIRTRTSGLANVDVERIDAAEVDLPAASFDAVVFRMGLMLVPEPDVALQQIRRVLRDGGRFGATVWGDPAHNPWLSSVGMAAMMHGLVQGGPPTGPGGPLSLHDPEALEKRARNAGFTDVSVKAIDYVRRYDTVDEHFDMVRVLAPPLAAAFAAATPEQVAAVRGTVHDLTAQYRDGDALDLPARALVVVAS
jgi:SAM-dependent methyltransferase